MFDLSFGWFFFLFVLAWGFTVFAVIRRRG